MNPTRATRVGSRGLVLALLAAVALLGWHPPTALAEDAASCQSSGGVYVYLQPGGGGCSRAGGNGMTILRSLTSVTTNSTGMICQLGGYPSTCPDPVPADDYWTYWDWNGTRWVYATSGAAADWPDPGSVRAWTFGNAVTPTVTPPQAASPATTAATSASSRTTTTSTSAAIRTTSATRTTRASSTTRTTSATAGATTTRPPASASPARTPSPSPTPASASTPAASGTATPIAVITTTPTAAPARGTPWGVVVAAGLVVLGGAGIVAAGRRR